MSYEMKERFNASDKAIDTDPQYGTEPHDARGGYWERAIRYPR